MQQLTVHIPENKVDFFRDLVENLGFKIEHKIQKNVLTEQQIKLVNDAKQKIKDAPDQFLDWDDVRKTIGVYTFFPL